MPLERITARGLVVAQAGTAPLTIKRDQGLSGAACRTRVFVNGAQAAEVGPGERVTFHLAAGEHMLAILAGGICGGGLTEAKVSMQQGRPQVYRISYGTAGEFVLQTTSF